MDCLDILRTKSSVYKICTRNLFLKLLRHFQRFFQRKNNGSLQANILRDGKSTESNTKTLRTWALEAQNLSNCKLKIH